MGLAKSPFGFFITSYGKNQMNILAKSVTWLKPHNWEKAVAEVEPRPDCQTSTVPHSQSLMY